MSNKKHILQCSQAYKSLSTDNHLNVYANEDINKIKSSDIAFKNNSFFIVFTAIVSARYRPLNKNKTDSNSQKIGKSLCVYTHISNGYTEKEMAEMHQTAFSAARAIEKYCQHRTIAAKILNRQVRRIWQQFDSSKPLRHASVTIKGMDISKPEECQQACIKALRHSGIEMYCIFGMEKGDNGIWHFHIVFQGSFRGYWQVFHRTGMSYHVFPDEKPRNEMYDLVELKEEGKYKDRIIGIHPTIKYNIENHHPNKRNYIIRKINR